MSKVHLTIHKGRPAVDVHWPDGLRSRVRVNEGQNGEELLLRIRLSILDASWPAIRASLTAPAKERPESPGTFGAMVDEYYNT